MVINKTEKRGRGRSPKADMSNPDLGRCHWASAGENAFFVERILDSRLRRVTKDLNFLVKWKYYPPSYNTWEPVSSFDFCPRAIEVYFKHARPKTKKFRYRIIYRNSLPTVTPEPHPVGLAASEESSPSASPPTTSAVTLPLPPPAATQTTESNRKPRLRKLQVVLRKLDVRFVPEGNTSANAKKEGSIRISVPVPPKAKPDPEPEPIEEAIVENDTEYEFLTSMLDDPDILEANQGALVVEEDDLASFWGDLVLSPNQNLPQEIERQLFLGEHPSTKRGRHEKRLESLGLKPLNVMRMELRSHSSRPPTIPVPVH